MGKIASNVELTLTRAPGVQLNSSEDMEHLFLADVYPPSHLFVGLGRTVKCVSAERFSQIGDREYIWTWLLVTDTQISESEGTVSEPKG